MENRLIFLYLSLLGNEGQSRLELPFGGSVRGVEKEKKNSL
jgi:hypothetical protein